jgi:hypothetical protein
MVGLTLPQSMNVTKPPGGGSPNHALVAATASTIKSDARPAPSDRKTLLTHAPRQQWRLYIGALASHTARPQSVTSTKQAAKGPNWGVPGLVRL